MLALCSLVAVHVRLVASNELDTRVTVLDSLFHLVMLCSHLAIHLARRELFFVFFWNEAVLGMDRPKCLVSCLSAARLASFYCLHYPPFLIACVDVCRGWVRQGVCARLHDVLLEGHLDPVRHRR